MTPMKSQTNTDLSRLRVFGGSSVPGLTDRICEHLGIKRADALVDRYPDGECTIKVEDDVRGKDCFVVQSTCPPVNDHLMELLVFIDSLRRASADRITAVIPYFGYARQDRKSEGRTPITAKLVANLLTTAGVDRVLTMDLHADQIQGFFDIPLDHLTAAPVLGSFFKELNLDNIVLLSPDVGNIKTANKFASQLGGELAVIDKRRESGDTITAARLIGDVKDKTVLIFDDMITTGSTAASAAKLATEYGASGVCMGATHPIFVAAAKERLPAAEFMHLVVTDTIPVAKEMQDHLKNLKILSIAGLMGEGIKRIHEQKSISALFSDWNSGR